MPLPKVPQTDSRPFRGQKTRSSFGPFDESHGFFEVPLQVTPLAVGHGLESVEVEMRYRHAPGVQMPDGEGRARHWPVDAEAVSRAANEGRLASAKLPGDRDHVTRLELLGEKSRDALGFLGRGRFDLDHVPSVEAGH